MRDDRPSTGGNTTTHVRVWNYSSIGPVIVTKLVTGDNIEKQTCLDALKNVKAIQTFYILFITLKLAKTGSP